MQERQAKLLEACGFPCQPAGEHEFYGKMIPMWQATGEQGYLQAELLGYGGAAYGGKSYGLLLLVYVAALLWPGVQIAYFRRTYSELDGPGAAIPKAYEVFGGVARATEGGKEWHWPNGSALYFRHCQNENDVYLYQSQQIDILLIDESTHFPWSMIDYLLTRNRASGSVKVAGFQPFAVLPSNPGNIGHAWYSSVFDVKGPKAKPARQHEQVKEVINPNGHKVKIYFIPAYLEDNPIGVAADPGYENRLNQRAAVIAKALRKGDWDMFAGQAFPTWTKDRIACTPFDIPSHWPRWRAMDYGFVHPMAVGWFTLDPVTKRVYIYRALKKSGLDDTQQAVIIREWTPSDEKIAVTYASPDMWSRSAKKTGLAKVETTVDEFKKEEIILTRADDNRINGVAKINRLLVDGPDAKPMIQVFTPYYEVFEIMEVLVHEDVMMGKNPEDVKKVNGDNGDDPFDMLKYGLTNMKQPENKDVIKRSQHPGRGVKGL